MQKNKANIHSPLNQHKIITTKKILKLKKIKRRKIKAPKVHNCNFGVNEFKNMKGKFIKNESNLGNNPSQIINKDIKPTVGEINILNNKSEKLITNINNITLLDDQFINKKETLLSSSIPNIPNSTPQNNNLEYSNNPFNLLSKPLFDDDKIYKYFDLEDMSLNDKLEIENFDNFFNPVLSEPIFDWNAFICENPPNIGNNSSLYNNNPIRNEINPNNNNQANNQNINNNQNNNQRIGQNNNNNRGSNQENDSIILSLDSQELLNQFDILFDDSIIFGRRQRNNHNKIKSIKNKLNRIKFKKSVFSNGNRETCIICYEDFKNNQNVYNLPCSHIFHVHCLNKEIKYRQKCPMCRNEL
jgi:hypothetical protein